MVGPALRTVPGRTLLSHLSRSGWQPAISVVVEDVGALVQLAHGSGVAALADVVAADDEVSRSVEVEAVEQRAGGDQAGGVGQAGGSGRTSPEPRW